MKTFRLLFFLLFLLLVHAGCEGEARVKEDPVQAEEVEEMPLSEAITREKMTADNYINWVRNPQNGLVKAKTIDDLKFTVQYKPYEYIVYLEERTDKVADTLLKRKVKELEGMQYYDLKILLKNSQQELLKSGLSTREEYEKRVNYFSFHMQQDIQLVDGNDTLPCALYHFERAYDVTPVCTLLLGFRKSESNAMKPKTLLVYERTFNKGLLKFTFKEKRLQTLPKLLTL